MKPEIRKSKSPRPALDAGYWMLDEPATRNLQEAALVRELPYRPETIIRKLPDHEMKA
jgi:hypothetical protein